ncbi:helix-turn-helix transcriptional regulator [Nocardioides mangrovi]|uniref:Response regulator transcription factor n=1 Tax=Nocardioides mangrovi TaxID=2874580 RepID=A0ABS7UCI9_9ACTN|nr:response regulator transcription factor [Nocardioides mangrovi]MBZ5738729.1 response regulator transcription factor [Nocardioides mangrovi]
MSRSGQVKVAIADRHALFAECFGMVLELRNYRYQAVPVPTGPGQSDRMLRRLLASHPDVVVINADLGPHCHAPTIIEALARAGVPVVAVTEGPDEALWGQCLAHGARGVVPKTEPLSALVSAVRRTGNGEPLLRHDERSRLIDVYRHEDAASQLRRERLGTLTTREGEILRHLMAGHTVHEIATRRFVSEATVRTQVKAILGKLDLSSQIAAVAAGRSGNWQSEALPMAG